MAYSVLTLNLFPNTCELSKSQFHIDVICCSTWNDYTKLAWFMNDISYWINLYYGALCQNSVDFCQGGNNYPGIVPCGSVHQSDKLNTRSNLIAKISHGLHWKFTTRLFYLQSVLGPAKSGRTAAHVINLPVRMPFIILLPRMNIWMWF